MIITILAVTKAYDKFCIAGINEKGTWIRPIPDFGTSRFWTRQSLTRRNGEFIKCGDQWQIEGYYPENFEFPNHTEDYVVTTRKYIGRLQNLELIAFLNKHTADEQLFLQTIAAQGRSLCLVKAKAMYPYVSNWEGNMKPKIKFDGFSFKLDNPLTNNKDYIIKDCKWARAVLDNEKFQNFKEIFVCIGLATPAPFNNIEYPQIIGIHTIPELPWHINYPD
jgi:hypothetical protein